MSSSRLERYPKRHLILHVDINKTIIQVDAAGGRTMEDVLNSNAAANVVGYVDHDNQWVALHGPAEPCPARGDDPRELLTYDAYVDRAHCAPPEMETMSKAERQAAWRRVSAARRAATRCFTEPHAAGCDYAHLVEEQRRCLTCGPGPQYHSILPSFFHLVNTLSALDWPFTLLFRTFGSDLAMVLREWRRFVFGEHVCKPRGPVLQRMRDHYVEPVTACLYRDHERIFLCYGPDTSAASHTTTLAAMEQVSLEFAAAELRKIPGCREVRQTSYATLNADLMEYLSSSNEVGGLVDYYPFWAQGAESRAGGKLFPVALRGPSAELYYYVFFDDNIFLGEQHSIVDLRDLQSGASVLDAACERAFCVPVNAYEAIVKEDYFVDALCHCLELQQHHKVKEHNARTAAAAAAAAS